jgi:hypothetical protein
MLQEMLLIGSREARYQPRSGRQIVVIIERTAGNGESLTSVDLLDISEGGAKIASPVCLETNETIGLRLEVAELHIDLRATAKVKWTCPTKDGRWQIGCVIDPRVPEAILVELAAREYLERRREQREPVNLEAEAQWEMDTDAVTVRIVNFSSGGFCLFSPNKKQIGQRVRVRLDDGNDGLVTARAVWQLKQQKGYLTGCELLDPSDANRFKAYVNGQCLSGTADVAPDPDAGAERRERRRRRRRRVLWLALAIAILGAGFQVGRTYLNAPEGGRSFQGSAAGAESVVTASPNQRSGRESSQESGHQTEAILGGAETAALADQALTHDGSCASSEDYTIDRYAAALSGWAGQARRTVLDSLKLDRKIESIRTWSSAARAGFVEWIGESAAAQAWGPGETYLSEATATEIDGKSPTSLDRNRHEVVLLNPPGNRGSVYYLVNGVVHSLAPGEDHQLNGRDPWDVRFDRGREFGVAEHTVSDGLFEFHVTEQGWRLVEIAERL